MAQYLVKNRSSFTFIYLFFFLEGMFTLSSSNSAWEVKVCTQFTYNHGTLILFLPGTRVGIRNLQLKS